MKAIKKLLNLIFIHFLLIKSVESKYNVTMAELSSCKEYRLKSGYGYNEFFKIEDMLVKRSDTEILRLKFYVMTNMDAHILLSETPSPSLKDLVYEIVIGAGSNTFSTIRRHMGMKQMVVSTHGGILSNLDPTPILVTQTEGGKLEITIPGKHEPHLTYTDENQINVKYVSFGTFSTTPARWFYDCEADPQNGGKFNQVLIENTKSLSIYDRLKEDLDTDYDSYTTPSNMPNVNLTFTLNGLYFNRAKSQMTTRAVISMNWVDSRLVWEPAEYEGFRSFMVPIYRYWIPTLRIINGIGNFYTQISPKYLGSLRHNGHVAVTSAETSFITWCDEETENWPNDILKCDIMLRLQDVGIELMYRDNSRGHPHSFVTFDWHLTNIRTTNEIFNSVDITDFGHSKPQITITLHMMRNKFFYQKVFYTPLIASSILLILSTCLTDYKRSGLNLIATLTLCICFITLSKYAPHTYVSKLMKFYQAALLISCITLILNIINKWMRQHSPGNRPPAFVMKIINFSALRILLGIRCSDAADYIKIQNEPWCEIAKILHRFTFIVLLVFFCCLWTI